MGRWEWVPDHENEANKILVSKKQGGSGNGGNGDRVTGHHGHGRAGFTSLAEIALDGSNYRPEDFIVPAQDDKGHSERQWFRCQPTIDRQIDVIVHSRKFPFRTKGDFIRWAVLLGLTAVEALEQDIPSVTAQVALIADMVRDDEFQADFDRTFTNVSNRVNQHMAEGRSGEARRMVAQMKAAIHAMPDGAWKQRYVDRWNGQFAGFLKTTGHGADAGAKGVMRVGAGSGKQS